MCIWGPARSNTAAKIYCFDKKKGITSQKGENKHKLLSRSSVRSFPKRHLQSPWLSRLYISTQRTRRWRQHTSQKNKIGNSATISQGHQCHLVQRWWLFFFPLSPLFGHNFPPGRQSGGLWPRFWHKSSVFEQVLCCTLDMILLTGKVTHYPHTCFLDWTDKSGHITLNWLVLFH